MNQIAKAVLDGLARLSRTENKKDYSAAEIAVAAWKLNKETLGLPGYESDYPDIGKAIIGLDECAAADLVDVALAPLRYRMSPAGWKAQGEEHGCHEQLALIGRLIATRAFGEFSYSAKSRIGVADAAEFWEGCEPEQIAQAINDVLGLMLAAEEVSFGGLFLSQSLLRILRYCNDYLAERFGQKAKYLANLMRPRDGRKHKRIAAKPGPGGAAAGDKPSAAALAESSGAALPRRRRGISLVQPGDERLRHRPSP